MKSTLFLASLLATPWAMQPDVMHAYAKVLARQYAHKLGANVEDEAPAGVAIAAAAPRPSARTASGSIAVLPLYGSIMQRAGMLEMCGGGTSTQSFTRAFRDAMADETVSQILIDGDSPGGSVYGVGELAAEIRAARGTKPVFGIANSVCASACYWIMSQCSELYVTPGGQVGSIGVIAAHEDMSKALEEAGINITLITYGEFKAEGNSLGPLDETALRSIQSDIDSYGVDFTNAVAKGRGVSVESVRNDMGRGRMLRGDAALAAGMVDGIATFDEVVKRMQRNAKSNSGRSALRSARNELSLIG